MFKQYFILISNQTIKIIDPRGHDHNGKNTIYGDLRYDLSKLTHSLIGPYDFIIAGRYEYAERTFTI